MAIAGSDGSIILTTSVDTSGITKGTVSIKSALQNVDSALKKVQGSFDSLKGQKATLSTLTQAIKDQQYVINSLNVEYAELIAKGKGNSQQAKELKGNIESLTAEMREMQSAANVLGNKGTESINKIGNTLKKIVSYFIGIQTIFAVINFSKQAGEFATQTEANGQRLIDIYGEASQVVGDFIDENARGIGMSRSMATSISATYGNLLSVWADQSTNAQLTNKLLNQTAVVASKTGRTVEDVSERIRSGLLGNTEAIEDLGINVNIKTIEITEAFKRIADGRSWQQLNAYEQSQIRTLAILEQSTNKYGMEVAETSATVRNQYNAAYEDFKATWGTVINVVLIPVLNVLTQVFTIATKGLQIIAGITGKTIKTTQIQSTNMNETAKAISKAVDNQKKLSKATKETAKEQKKFLADFDEMIIISQQDSGSGGAGTNAVSAVGGLDSGVKSGGVGDTGSGTVGAQGTEINEMLAGIMAAAGLALLAIGLILLFNGQIAWGIGFIISGATFFAVSAAALSQTDFGAQILGVLTTIMGIAGGALLALGIILLCIGGVVGKGVAIGMIIAGGALIVSAVAAKAAFSPDDVGGWLTLIMGIAAGALLALGIILCMVGSTPLGVGMIIAGSVALVSAVGLNFNAVTDQIKGWVAVIMAIAGAALLVLGIVLCVTGAGIALGIALIVAGAIALVTPIALNWNYITEKVTQFFQDNAGLIVGVSIALIVLGIILLFTGVGIPLAIGLIVAGGGALAATVALNWNFIVDKVKEVWGNIKDFWNTYIAPIFTAKWWTDLAEKCGNGLISGFEGAVNGIIGMFEKMINWVVQGLNKIKFDVPDWVPEIGGKTFGFNISKVKFDRVSIPRLAKGTVIPPNREFAAILGDQKRGINIEAPLDTIVEAMNISLQNNGAGQTTKEEHYYLNETELMSVIYKLVKGGERLRGNSLITGGGY